MSLVFERNMKAWEENLLGQIKLQNNALEEKFNQKFDSALEVPHFFG